MDPRHSRMCVDATSRANALRMSAAAVGAGRLRRSPYTSNMDYTAIQVAYSNAKANIRRQNCGRWTTNSEDMEILTGLGFRYVAPGMKVVPCVPGDDGYIEPPPPPECSGDD